MTEGPFQMPLLTCQAMEFQLGSDGLVVDLCGARGQEQLGALGPIPGAHAVDKPRGVHVGEGSLLKVSPSSPGGPGPGPLP